jgi:hypothetical protein
MGPIWHTANWATKIAASIAASILVVSTSPAVSDKRLAATPSTKRFAGRTVTIALPGTIKTGLGTLKNDWESETGARLKVIVSD